MAEQKKEGPDHTVVVTRKSSKPDPAYVRAGNVVRWQSDEARQNVNVKFHPRDTPLNKHHVQLKPGEYEDTRVRENAGRVHPYRYRTDDSTPAYSEPGADDAEVGDRAEPQMIVDGGVLEPKRD